VSKHSISGTTSCSANAAAMRRRNGTSPSKMRSPKLIVPQSRLAISGRRVSGASRSSRTERPPAVPHERLMTASQPAARMPSTRTAKASASWVGVPSCSRAWRWITAAPARDAASASTTIASGVIGRFGARSGSGDCEPVTAHWITTGVGWDMGSCSSGRVDETHRT
jgi:hypothetical protein